MAASPDQIQSLIKARTDLYGREFTTLNAKGVSSWHSQDIVFNDICKPTPLDLPSPLSGSI